MKSADKYWDRVSRFYNGMFDNDTTYAQMYALIKASLKKDMHVLEVGTGTGLIAREIADEVKHIQATDYSEKMIKVAQNIEHASNITYSCANVFDLPFENNTFDAVVAANILHIIPNPEKALESIHRVLKTNGLLIAPTFLWKDKINLRGKIQKIFMQISGIPLHSKWDKTTYAEFIQNNNFEITKSVFLKSSFFIGYIECKKI